MKSWVFSYDGFEPEKEDLREALCTLGNGYIATRGAACEAEADAVHYPGTYLAGGYNRLSTKIADREVENEDLVNLPNWLPLNFRIEDESWFSLSEVELLSYKQRLDIRKGVLIRTLRFKDGKARVTKIENRRFVHMGECHVAAVQTKISPENWSGTVEVLSALDGRVINGGVERYKALSSKHLEFVRSGKENGGIIYLEVQTVQSKLHIAQGARTRVYKENRLLRPKRKIVREKGYIGESLTFKVEKGKEYTLEKVVTIYTSRDRGISECGLQAKKSLVQVGSFEELYETHVLAWKHIWKHFEIDYESRDVEEGKRVEQTAHLYMFHVLQTVSVHTMDLDVGVPARGLHGEAYRGHIFWDELFVLPLLNFRLSEITRALLMYRYRRLPEARIAAEKLGYCGAMFPWQSGSCGREETQHVHLNPKSGRWIPDNSSLQRHVNGAIAYNIWHYFQVTGDMEFLSFHGAEMFLEIARFLSSITTYNEKIERYEILHVMGPDEYHDALPGANEPGLPNNAYTNIMTVWVLRRALDVIDILGRSEYNRICETIGLEAGERKRWRDICEKMVVPFHDDGIISQFEGYEKLEEFDWDEYREKYGDIQRLDRILEAEGDSPNRYKASKQADVLMLFYLFSAEEIKSLFEGMGYVFDTEMISRNIMYYLTRTSHGSTLSRVVHAWVLSRFDRKRSWKFFAQALESDVADIQRGTTPEGVHLGAIAGTIDILQRAYTGLEVREECLRFNPALPEGLDRLYMTLRYRGNRLDLEITPEFLRIRALTRTIQPIRIAYRDQIVELSGGEACEFALKKS